MRKYLPYLFLFFLLSSFIYAADSIVTNYVTDNAGVISEDTRLYLNEALKELESNTNGVQLVVFTESKIPDGMTLEERSLQIAEQNKIGQEDQDNGILFYLAVEDREYRWEVGYGAESTLNSALLGRISREHMVPYFRDGDYELGILKGVSEIQIILLDSKDSDIVNSGKSKGHYDTLMLVILIIIIFFTIIMPIASLIIGIIYAIKNGKKGTKSNNYHNTAASSIFWGTGGFGRGGSGGFGGGGFSGGGGSFGGGGFSGKF